MSQDEHRIGRDGIREDGVSTYPIDTHDRQLIEDARLRISQQQMPVLLRTGDPNARVFLAAFDGTGNDAIGDPRHKTNVALVAEQVEARRRSGRHELGVGYVKGPGTQEHALPRLIDGATGHSYDANLEQMYLLFARQARTWLQENPDATISLAELGFSRGAEQAAGFARLVHERGIADPDSRVVTHDEHGNTIVSYSRTLVPPGRTAQVAVLLDPVPTGEPAAHDRRLPPSAIARVQFTAEDERRSLFRASHHVPFGTSDDGRHTNVWVPGAHSDIGGGYHRNGLSTRIGNLAIDALNAISDRPFLTRQPEHDDPRLDVVHRSEQGSPLYRLTPKVNRHNPNGMRDDLGGQKCHSGCDRAELADESLASRFGWQSVAVGKPVSRMADPMVAARHEVDALFERMSAGALSGEVDAARAAGREYLQSDDGRQLQREGRALAEAPDPLTPSMPHPALSPPALEPAAPRHPIPVLQR